MSEEKPLLQLFLHLVDTMYPKEDWKLFQYMQHTNLGNHVETDRGVYMVRALVYDYPNKMTWFHYLLPEDDPTNFWAANRGLGFRSDKKHIEEIRRSRKWGAPYKKTPLLIEEGDFQILAESADQAGLVLNRFEPDLLIRFAKASDIKLQRPRST